MHLKVHEPQPQPKANPNKKWFECYICKMQMNTCASVRRHLKQHPYSKLKCEICSQHLASSEAKQFHLCDTVEHSIKCEYCDGRYQAISALLAHLDCEHVNRTMYKCRKCLKCFAMKQLVDVHEKHHSHPEDERPFACNQCSSRFVEKRVLTTHMNDVHSTSMSNV